MQVVGLSSAWDWGLRLSKNDYSQTKARWFLEIPLSYGRKEQIIIEDLKDDELDSPSTPRSWLSRPGTLGLITWYIMSRSVLGAWWLLSNSWSCRSGLFFRILCVCKQSKVLSALVQIPRGSESPCNELDSASIRTVRNLHTCLLGELCFSEL